MMAEARREIDRAIASGLLIDGQVAGCGYDISLIMTHTYGADAGLIHSFAWNTFQATTHIAKGLGLYGAGQDLLPDAFSGNLRGMGPGYAELESEVPFMEAKQWTVQIYITEEGDDTSARALLTTKDDTHLTGIGHARRNPADQSVPEIGDELAVARALADLAERLRTVTAEDIAQVTGPTS